MLKKGAQIYLVSVLYSRFTGIICLLLTSYFFISVFYYIITKYPYIGSTIAKTKKIDLPNIILLSADGLETTHMSAYGYKRNTTPYIDQIAQKSTIYTKAFSNAGNSRGSVVSLLTGKSPLSTKVIFPPDILVGEDAFQHLPGILSDIGYYCIDMGDGYFISPRKSNMQLAFHNENGEKTKFGNDNPHINLTRRIFVMEMYFLSEIYDRFWHRIGYLLGLSKELLYPKKIIDMIEMVSHQDEKHIVYLMEKIRGINQPIFAHIHLLKTHGPKFHDFKKLKFSINKMQNKDWDDDFYDDAILTIDYYFGMLVRVLEETEKIDNTLFVIHTDHGQKSSSYKTLPLIVHVPGQQQKQVNEKFVQYLDIAPSILYFLGIKIPNWMEGTPIFQNTSDNDALDDRAIYIVKAATRFDDEKKKWLKKSVGPPLYGVVEAAMLKKGILFILFLDTGYKLIYDFNSNIQKPEKIYDLDNENMLEYQESLLSFLKTKNFDTESIVLKR